MASMRLAWMGKLPELPAMLICYCCLLIPVLNALLQQANEASQQFMGWHLSLSLCNIFCQPK